MRIIFRSEERSRGQLYAPLPPSASPAALAPPGAQASAGAPDRSFAIGETADGDQALRLTLLGDLDLTAAEVLGARLADLKSSGRMTRIDLSQLGFIDSSGIQALLVALTDARWNGWPLEIAPGVSPTVERAAQIVGIAEVLWPQGRSPSGTRQGTSPTSTA